MPEARHGVTPISRMRTGRTLTSSPKAGAKRVARGPLQVGLRFIGDEVDIRAKANSAENADSLSLG